MKKLAIIICCLLTTAAWGQRRERKLVNAEVRREAVSHAFSDYRPIKRTGSVARAGKVKRADGVPQAPGVLQINLSDRDRSAWFVSTEVIPAGSAIIAYIVPPDDENFLKIGPVYVEENILPGKSFLLPKIADFGILWPVGVTTYDVVVRLNNRYTHSAADFTIGGARNYEDLGVVTPLIYQWTESIEERQLILNIDGEFTGEPVKILLEDLVVPPDAIYQNGRTIKVNLSKVAGTRLHLYQDFLLTVGQDGFSDTRIFTHVPFHPDKYDPAPALE